MHTRSLHGCRDKMWVLLITFTIHEWLNICNLFTIFYIYLYMHVDRHTGGLWASLSIRHVDKKCKSQRWPKNVNFYRFENCFVCSLFIVKFHIFVIGLTQFIPDMAWGRLSHRLIYYKQYGRVTWRETNLFILLKFINWN